MKQIREINVLSMCDGEGTGKMAFDMLGIKVNYWAVEINPHARKIADHNLEGITRPLHDLTEITPEQMLMLWPMFDFVFFGFTCKSLSRQSNGDDLKGSSKILFDCMQVLSLAKYRNPKVRFLIENVSSMRNTMKEVISKIIGVPFVEVNSALVSGQARQRLYWANWDFPLPKDRGIMANDILEDDAKELRAWSKSTRYKCLKTGKIFGSPAEGRVSYIEDRFRKDGKSHTLVTGKGCQGPSTKNWVITKDGQRRMLTVRECARLQSKPDSFDYSCVSENQAYEAIGNGWNLDTIVHILKYSFKKSNK